MATKMVTNGIFAKSLIISIRYGGKGVVSTPLKTLQYFHAEKAKPRFRLRGREGRLASLAGRPWSLFSSLPFGFKLGS